MSESQHHHTIAAAGNGFDKAFHFHFKKQGQQLVYWNVQLHNHLIYLQAVAAVAQSSHYSCFLGQEIWEQFGLQLIGTLFCSGNLPVHSLNKVVSTCYERSPVAADEFVAALRILVVDTTGEGKAVAVIPQGERGRDERAAL